MVLAQPILSSIPNCLFNAFLMFSVSRTIFFIPRYLFGSFLIHLFFFILFYLSTVFYIYYFIFIIILNILILLILI